MIVGSFVGITFSIAVFFGAASSLTGVGSFGRSFFTGGEVGASIFGVGAGVDFTTGSLLFFIVIGGVSTAGVDHVGCACIFSFIAFRASSIDACACASVCFGCGSTFFFGALEAEVAGISFLPSLTEGLLPVGSSSFFIDPTGRCINLGRGRPAPRSGGRSGIVACQRLECNGRKALAFRGLVAGDSCPVSFACLRCNAV